MATVRLYLRDTSGGPATADTDLILSTTAGVSGVSSATNTVGGPTSGVQCLASTGGNASWWNTTDVASGTISGTITFNFYMSENSMSANVGPQCILERCDSSGSVISTVVNSEQGVELTTSLALVNWTGASTSTTFAATDYLRLRVLGNDVGTMASGFTFALSYNKDVAGLSDAWVEFTFTPASVAPPFSRRHRNYIVR